jgi:hypothetical protein
MPPGSECAGKPSRRAWLARHGRSGAFREFTDRGNDARRPNSGATGRKNAKSANPFVNTPAEARRIAGGLVKLHKAGAIKNEQDSGPKSTDAAPVRPQTWSLKTALRKIVSAIS